MRTSIFAFALIVALIAASLFVGACGAMDAPLAPPEGNPTEFARAVGYAVSSPDGSVDVTLVSRDGAPLATGHWEATARSLDWMLEEGTVGGLSFDRFAPTAEGVTALVYSQWTVAHPEPTVTCDSDGTCTTHQQLACELNCYFWTGDTYGNCWCGCNPGGHSCSYGCCI